MERKLNLAVGQEVVISIIRYTSNACRYVDMTSLNNIDEWTYNATVTKITKKQIHVAMKIGECINKEIFVIDDDYRQKYTTGGAEKLLFFLSNNE